MTSFWKRVSNKKNAQKSTGPRTEEGKKTSSRNSMSHGLFCDALVLEGESQQAMEFLRQQYIRSLRPQDLLELQLVDRIVAASWKLRRLQESEALIHASKGDALHGLLERQCENLMDEMD